MTKLNKDWLTDGLIDFEYKKYVILAYLQDIKKHFDRTRLYPFLEDLIFHYRNLQSIKQNKEIAEKTFPKELSKADLEKLKLSYKKVLKDDEVMQEIETIMEYALEKFDNVIKEGVEIYEFVEDNIKIEPVGIIPLYADEGYIMMTHSHEKELHIYKYICTVFQNSTEALRGIHLKLMDIIEKSIFNTYENIKLSLSKTYRELPNPATFHLHSSLSFPIQETLLPVSKRAFVRYLKDLE